MGLTAAGDVRVGLFSSGMHRRLGMARALLVDPTILLVDEATHDLDPAGADAIRALVQDAAHEGAAVIWATHRLEELRGFADRVTVLDRGDQAFTGTLADLTSHAEARRYVIRIRARDATTMVDTAVRVAAGPEATIVGSDTTDEYVVSLSNGFPLGTVIAGLSRYSFDVLTCRRSGPPRTGAALPHVFRGSMSTAEITPPREALRPELAKLSAFIERDFLMAWSYRASFLSDIVGLGGHVIVFYFVGRLVDSSRLPSYNGASSSYLQWASVGIALGIFMHFALERVGTAVRGEQLMGTFESVLVTPTRMATFQVGSVSFDMLYLPLRTAVFLGGIALAFGLHFDAAGIAPALLLLFAFVPFVWGSGSLPGRQSSRSAAARAPWASEPSSSASRPVCISDLASPALARRDRQVESSRADDRRNALVVDRRSGARRSCETLLVLVPAGAFSFAVGTLLFGSRWGVSSVWAPSALLSGRDMMPTSAEKKEDGRETMRVDNARITWREVDGEIVAVDVNTAEYLTMNGSGAMLWKALAPGATKGELAACLVGTYTISAEQASSDVDAFLGVLHDRGLIVLDA